MLRKYWKYRRESIFVNPGRLAGRPPPLRSPTFLRWKTELFFNPVRAKEISPSSAFLHRDLFLYLFLKRTLNNHVSRTAYDVVAFLFQFGFESGRREGSEPERWPQILLHEPVWEVQGPAAHTLETRGANPQDRYDHRTGMKRVSVESNYNRYDLISLWVGTSEMWL